MLRLFCMCSHIAQRNCGMQSKKMTITMREKNATQRGASTTTTIMYLYWYQIGGVVTISNCLIGVNFVYSFDDWNVCNTHSLCMFASNVQTSAHWYTWISISSTQWMVFRFCEKSKRIIAGWWKHIITYHSKWVF